VAALHTGLYRVVYVPVSTGNEVDLYKTISCQFRLLPESSSPPENRSTPRFTEEIRRSRYGTGRGLTVGPSLQPLSTATITVEQDGKMVAQAMTSALTPGAGATLVSPADGIVHAGDEVVGAMFFETVLYVHKFGRRFIIDTQDLKKEPLDALREVGEKIAAQF
jgi:hypothetical protein